MIRLLSRLTGGRLGARLRARAVKRNPTTASKLLAVSIAATTAPRSAMR